MCIGNNWAEFAIIAVVIVGHVRVYIDGLKARLQAVRDEG